MLRSCANFPENTYKVIQPQGRSSSRWALIQKNVVVVGGDPCCLLECYVSSTSPSTRKRSSVLDLERTVSSSITMPSQWRGDSLKLLVGIARRTVVEIGSWVQTAKKLTWDELSESSSTHNNTENKW